MYGGDAKRQPRANFRSESACEYNTHTPRHNSRGVTEGPWGPRAATPPLAVPQGGTEPDRDARASDVSASVSPSRLKAGPAYLRQAKQ